MLNDPCIAATIEWKARTTSASGWADPDVYSQDVFAAILERINLMTKYYFLFL
jgi:hypothetical protein